MLFVCEWRTDSNKRNHCFDNRKNNTYIEAWKASCGVLCFKRLDWLNTPQLINLKYEMFGELVTKKQQHTYANDPKKNCENKRVYNAMNGWH
jgi:hypothetical protein